MSEVSDRLDRIEADVARGPEGDEMWWYVAPNPEDFDWLLSLARGHDATLRQIADMGWKYSSALARERLKEADGE